MSSKTPLHVLIIEKRMDDASRFVSLLRNETYEVDAKHAEDEQALQKLLPSRNWDLIIANQQLVHLPPNMLFQRLRRAEKDIPVIFHTSSNNPVDIVEGLRMGAEDVIFEDQDQHFLLAVKRAIKSLHCRRDLRQWQRRYLTSEKRSQQLIMDSRHPVAIVQEGTYVYVNESWSHYLGYDDADDLVHMPVIDSIDEDDHHKFMDLLKPLNADVDIESFALEFTAIDSRSNPLKSFVEVNQIQFEDEPAIQLTLKVEKVEATASSTSAISNGLDFTSIQPNRVFEIVNNAVNRVARTSDDSMMVAIAIDDFDTLKAELGIATSDTLAVNVATMLKDQLPEDIPLGRLEEETFVWVLDQPDPDKALAQTSLIVNKISGEIFNVDDGTVQITVSAGLVVVNESVTSIDKCLARAKDAINKLRAKNDGKIGNAAVLYEPDIHAEDISTDEATLLTARKFIKENKFTIHFQPLIALKGNPKHFYETRLRVAPGVTKESMPEDFLKNIWKSEAAFEMDCWVFVESCKALARHLDTHPKTQMFVTITAQTYRHEKFIYWLQSTLKTAQLDAKHFVFQINEGDASRNLNQAADVAKEIKEMGGAVALVNFGLTPNPMKILERIKPDFVKLDSGLVADVNESNDKRTSFEQTITNLRAITNGIIVPSVEKATIIPMLWQQGVDYIQGKYVQDPGPKMDFEFESHQ